MGQTASKSVTKPATRAAKKVAQSQKQRPPPPSPERTAKSNAANPGMFLRGEGFATQDIRDVGQEMFLQEKHKLDGKQMAKGPPEMSPDLLKFIQITGPAKQQVDKNQTAPRLLEKENESELQKAESARQPIRERTRMPLISGDEAFTTTRNTNFAMSQESDAAKEFGATNLQLYDLLRSWTAAKTEMDLNTFVEAHHRKLVSEAEGWSEAETTQQKVWIRQTLESIELPVLRKDPDGNIIGLYADSVPGEEVKSLQPIPPTKISLVLDDVWNANDASFRKARENLSRSRQRRIKS